MGIQDNFTTIGDEAVVWGTKAATLTRGIENQSDDDSPQIDYRESRGMRPATVGTPTGRSAADDRGGMYTITADMLSASFGLLFGSVASVAALTTPAGATNARMLTFTPSTAGVSVSRTVHQARYDITGTAHHHDYLGWMATQLDLSVAAKGLAPLKVAGNYKAINTAAASVTPAYPTSPYVFKDTDCTVTVNGGSTLCQRQFDLSIPTNLEIARDRVCPGGREKPLLLGRISPTGTMSIDYADDTWHNAYRSGDELEDLVIDFQGPEIEAGFNYSVKFTFPLIQLTGSAPKVGIDVLPEQPIPWKAIDNLTDPLWKIEYQTTDVAI